jgi:hypothetical protein
MMVRDGRFLDHATRFPSGFVNRFHSCVRQNSPCVVEIRPSSQLKDRASFARLSNSAVAYFRASQKREDDHDMFSLAFHFLKSDCNENHLFPPFSL